MHRTRMSVYAGGEAVGGFGALQTPIMRQLEALARVPQNMAVGLTAQLDRERASSHRFVLDDPVGRPTFDVGEGNTGDPNELVQFVRWSREVRPAVTEILVLSGHGLGFLSSLAGWAMEARSILPGLTATGAKDLLTTVELAAALRTLSDDERNGCDVLVFDACLMNTVEVITELVDVAPVVVGTPDELSGGGYNLAGAASALMHAGSPPTPVESGESVVRSYTPQHAADMCVAMSMGAVQRHEVLACFQDFAERGLVLAGRASGREALRVMFAQAASGLNRFRSGGLADLAALRHAAAQVDGQLAYTLDRAIGVLGRCVVGRVSGPAANQFLGVSTACPSSKQQWNRDRKDYSELLFGRESGWCNLFDIIFESA